MKNIRILLYLVWLMAGMACSDDKYLPVLETDRTDYKASHAGENFLLHISSNDTWTLQSNAVWCQVGQKTGNGNTEVNVTVQANQKGESREAKLILASNDLKREITISQNTLLLELDSLNIKGDIQGGESQIKVYANVNWEVECESAWLHITSPLTGQDTGYIQIKVDANKGAQRSTPILVKAGKMSKTINYVQEGLFVQHLDREYRLYRQEDKAKPIKLIFMGDGFIEEDLRDKAAYDQAMEKGIESFFAKEPYKTYRDYFCPYIVYARSEERGMSYRNAKGEPMITKNTVFKTWLKLAFTNMGADYDKISEYAKLIPNLEQKKLTIMVIANDKQYGGTCAQFSDGKSIALIPMSENSSLGTFENILRHEAAGHGFGRLGDEYREKPGSSLTDEAKEALDNSHKNGLNLNLSSSHDTATVFWHDFIGRSGYESVGLFEGGYYVYKGIWRCEQDCCMVRNLPYFCVACRLAIVKRIKELAGESFDLNDFIAKDVQKAYGPRLSGYRSSNDYLPLAAPIFMTE